MGSHALGRTGVRRLVCPVLIFACAALLAGCRLDAQLAIDVEPAGDGLLTLALGADAELVRRLRAADADPLGELARTVRRQPEWEVTRRRTADGGSRVVLRTRFADPVELARLTDELSAALNAPELRVLRPFELTVQGRRMTLRGSALLEPGPAISDYGLTPAEAVELLSTRDAVAYTVRVQMPGVIELTDGVIADAGVVRYRIEPGTATDVLVVAQRPLPWRLIILVAVAALVLLAALTLRRRRRRASVLSFREH